MRISLSHTAKYVPILFFVAYVLVISAGYLFELTSPRGYPWDPVLNLYSINDFDFYSDFVKSFKLRTFVFSIHSGEMIPGPIFPILVFINNIFIGNWFLILCFCALSISILSFITKFDFCGEKNTIFYSLSPFLFFFAIFPSPDLITTAAHLALVYALLDDKSISRRVVLISFTLIALKPLGIVIVCGVITAFLLHRCILLGFQEFFYFFKKCIYNIGVIGLITGVFLFYYRGYVDAHLIHWSEFGNSPAGLLQNLKYLVLKFFWSFGLRESFETSGGINESGVVYLKNSMYSVLRLIIGFFSFTGFFLMLFQKISNSASTFLLIFSFFFIFLAGLNGFGFERYFLTYNIIFFGFFWQSIFHYLVKPRFSYD